MSEIKFAVNQNTGKLLVGSAISGSVKTALEKWVTSSFLNVDDVVDQFAAKGVKLATNAAVVTMISRWFDKLTAAYKEKKEKRDAERKAKKVTVPHMSPEQMVETLKALGYTITAPESK